MTADALPLLTAMHLADSSFPSGLFAFSWGLEAALAEGQADPRNLAGWIGAELHGRWHPFDRVALAGGWRLEGTTLTEWDALVDTSIPAEAQRQQSLQAGAALAASARRIGLPLEDGHAPVVHGRFLRLSGLDLPGALAVSAMGMARGLASAAVRLGRVGAVGVQRDLRALLPHIAALTDPPGPGDLPASFAPISDIALMRPLVSRLFVN